MQYTKPPLDFQSQAKLLMSRGILADELELTHFLSRVNYYRFTGYLYPFRQHNDDRYITGTTFEQVRDIYRFDTELRLFTLSAVEQIEIAILRTQMVEKFTLACGPFCYSEYRNFSKTLSKGQHLELMTRLGDNVNRSNEEFIERYRRKYSSEKHFPFWMVAEVSTFGLLSQIFQYLPFSIQVPIAKQYNLHSDDLVSWLRCLSLVRNLCAHHSRLWNRILPIKPSIPSKKHHPEFHSPSRINNDSYFVILALLRYLLDVISPNNTLILDFLRIQSKYPDVPFEKMGFPGKWKDFPIFKV